MTHEEFRRAYGSGVIEVQIDRAGAARYLSARLLLPLVRLPVLGAGVALALIGWIWTGLAVIGAAIAVPGLIRRSAGQFVLSQALQDESVYRDVTHAQILRISGPGMQAQQQ